MRKTNQCIKIAIENIKGGVGKTTTAVSMAGELAKREFKVLFVDMDPQGNGSSNLGRRNTQDYSIGDALIGEIDVVNVIKDTEIENLYILPSNLNLLSVAKYIESDPQRRADIRLVKMLKLIENDFDFMIIDCSPYDNILVTNALVATDKVIIPIKLDKNSMEGFDYLQDKIANIKEDSNENIEIIGILPTCYRNSALHKELLERLRESAIKNLLFKTYIRMNVKVEEAPFYNMPITEYKPSSNGAIDYKKFVDELLEKLDIQAPNVISIKEVR